MPPKENKQSWMRSEEGQIDLQKQIESLCQAYANFMESQWTSIFVYNRQSENYELQAFVDQEKLSLPEKKKIYPREIYDQPDQSMMEIIDCKNKEPYNAFTQKFTNANTVLEGLKARYLLLIYYKKKLAVILTLSERRDHKDYTKEEFERLRILVSVTYMGMGHASTLKSLKIHKERIHMQLQYILRMNQMMQSMNSAFSEEGLIRLLLSTLTLSFGFDYVGFAEAISFTDEKKYRINYKNIKGDIANREFTFQRLPYRLQNHESLFLYTTQQVAEFLELAGSKVNRQRLEENEIGGMILVPLTIDEDDLKTIGFLTACHTENGTLFDEENIFILESIAKYVAPVFYHLKSKSQIQSEYIKDYHLSFKERLFEEISEAASLDLDLYITHVHSKKKISFRPLMDTIIWQNKYVLGSNIFPLDHQNLLMITDKPIVLSEMTQASDIESRTYIYGRDFTSYEELCDKLE